MARHRNTPIAVNHFVFAGEGLGHLCLLDPVLTVQQVAQNQISLNLCSLLWRVNSVIETDIFAEHRTRIVAATSHWDTLLYTRSDLLPRQVTCYPLCSHFSMRGRDVFETELVYSG